ncbi:hypothetical protein HK405_008298 [Cladochytrium tenue]|nr:hypothetical protein HK405_008298 [Cladochytrium tenue]
MALAVPTDPTTAAAAGGGRDSSIGGETAKTSDAAAEPGTFAVAASASASTSVDEEEAAGAAIFVDEAVKPDVALADEPSPTPEPIGRVQFFLLYIGLCLAVFLASLDQTIIAVALNAIATEFNSLNQIAWVATAYFLTATAFIPSYGQLADLFGRKWVFMSAIVIFEVGSALCGAATSMNMLIAARAVAGLGGGGIFSLVIIIISDIVAIQDRGKYMGILGAFFGVSSVAGPLLGGVFVDNLTWRWVFYINLPFGAVTILTVIFFLNLPHEKSVDYMAGLLRIDWLGTFLLVCCVVCLLIPLEGGGTLYAWDSPIVISLFVVAGVLLITLIYVEGWVAGNPIIPFDLFKDTQVVASFLVPFFFGSSFFGLIFYLPQWFEVVIGSSATNAGIHTLPMILGLVVLSILSGVLASATGHAFPFIPIGAILILVSGAVCGLLDESSQLWAQVIYLLVGGIGAGSVVQTMLLVGQFSVPTERMATMTALINFWQTIGGVLGLAAFSVTFNNKLLGYVVENIAEAQVFINETQLGIALASPEMIRVVLDPEQQAPVIHGYVQTLRIVFLMTIPFAGAMFIVSMFMKKTKLPVDKLAEATMAA